MKRGDSFFESVFDPFLFNGLSLEILQSKGNFESFIERLHSFDIGKVKTTAQAFKNLPDKLSITMTFSGLVSLNNFKTSYSEVGEKVNFCIRPKLNLN